MEIYEEVFQGEIYFAQFNDDALDSEQRGRRPCVIVSNQKNNRFSSTVNVVPLTSHIDKSPIPVHVVIGTESGLRVTSIALVEQETTISKRRLGFKIGQCSKKVMKSIKEAIKIQKDIETFDVNRAYRLLDALKGINKLISECTFEKDAIESKDAILYEFKVYCEEHNKNCEDIMNQYSQYNMDFHRRTVLMA